MYTNRVFEIVIHVCVLFILRCPYFGVSWFERFHSIFMLARIISSVFHFQ